MNANVDLRIIPRGGLGPLRFGASIDEILRVLGPPSDPYHSPELLKTQWPDQWSVDFRYREIHTTLELVNTPSRGPCVVTMETSSPDATFVGVKALEVPTPELERLLVNAGVESLGEMDYGNGHWMACFSHGLLLDVYFDRRGGRTNYIRWTIDDNGNGKIDWSLLEQAVG